MYPRPFGVVALLALVMVARAEPGQFSENWQTLTGCTLIENEWNDGDSFHVRAKGREYIFRLYFVDAPEVHDVSSGKSRTTEQARYWKISKTTLATLADAATNLSRSVLASGPFTVLTRWEDARGDSHLPRQFAVIQTSRGDLAELLVSNGLARIHGHYLNYPGGLDAGAYQARLKSIEAKARSARLGGWSQSRPSVPDSRGSGDHLESAGDSSPMSDLPGY